MKQTLAHKILGSQARNFLFWVKSKEVQAVFLVVGGLSFFFGQNGGLSLKLIKYILAHAQQQNSNRLLSRILAHSGGYHT